MRKHNIAVALACVVFFAGAAPPVRPGDPISAEDQAQITAIPIERIAPADYFPEWYQLGHKIPAAFSPNDEYFPYNSPAGFPGQWNLENQTPGGGPDANLRGAWDRDLTGTGVTIGIVDDGLQWAHPDLGPNFVLDDSWDFRGQHLDPRDPSPLYASDSHGTAVAGVAAAEGGNSIGVTGAAPEAGLAGLRIQYLGGTEQMFADATTYHSSGENTNIKIKNHSYYYPAPYIHSTTEVTALGTSAAAGTLHTFAAGNDRVSHGSWDSQKDHAIDGDANKKHLQSDPESITVAALAEDGTFAYYSNWGANVFVTAPSSGTAGFGVTTTDLLGVYGYNGFPPVTEDYLDYTPTFGGTSAAAPLVAGIIALGMQAYPPEMEMDVRAAKHLLARTAAMVDPGDVDPMGGWVTNAAGFHFNNNYGFGLIDADAFTSMAELVHALTDPATQGTGSVAVGEAFGGALGTPTELSDTFLFNTSGVLEDVEVYLDITHTFRGQVEAYLTSPGGTTSRLMTRNASDVYDEIDWTFVSNAFWGEDAVGTWELRVIDTNPASDDGTWDYYAVTANTGTLIFAGEWKLATSGSYNDSANWIEGFVPNAVDAVANFLGNITGASTVTVDAPVTVGAINFDNAYSYTIAGPAGITLNAPVGDAQISVLSGEHTISAPLTLVGGLAVDTADGSAVTVGPATGYSGLEGDLTKTGGGLLALGNRLLVLGELNVNAGEVSAAPNVLALEGGDVNLGDGATLKASGTINRHVVNAGDPRTSTLEATGALEVGVLGDTDGYDYESLLVIGPHTVGLRDANLADLRGATIAGGTLSTYNGLHLMSAIQEDLYNTIFMGYGTIHGNIVAGEEMTPPTPHKRAVIWADGGSIEITGVITGAWTPIGNINITGTSRPGFSPEIGLVSAPSTVGDVDMQIYGNVGMHDEVPEHANPLNLPAADGTNGYDQVLGYADYSGASEVTLDGPLSLSFPTSYRPTLGDEFVLYFSHAFDPAFGEVPGAEFVYTDGFMAALPDLLGDLPKLANRSWSYVATTGTDQGQRAL